VSVLVVPVGRVASKQPNVSVTGPDMTCTVALPQVATISPGAGKASVTVGEIQPLIVAGDPAETTTRMPVGSPTSLITTFAQALIRAPIIAQRMSRCAPGPDLPWPGSHTAVRELSKGDHAALAKTIRGVRLRRWRWAGSRT